MIELNGVRKTYGRTVAVERVDLAVGAGELVGLIGHNGAGKSTVLKMIGGQLLPTEGTVKVGGVDVREDPNAARERLGLVPEDVALYEYLTAREFLEFVIDVRGRGDLAEGLAVAGLGADADRLIREYSQGMRRKTAIAAAVVARPPVLVLDEALNGLDPPSAARVKEHLHALRLAGTAILLSTHVLETVERLATRVVMLAHGRVVADAAVEDIGEAGLERMFLERIGQSVGG
ncbi:MAG: ABC transporter ATP-binding protein [Myxococcota bacterium]